MRTWTLITILFLTVIFILSPPAYSSTVDIHDLSGPVKIGKKIQFLKDIEKKLAIDDVEKRKEGWTQNHKDNINTGVSKDHYWFRFSVKNSSLERLYLNINYSQIMEIRFYYRLPNGKWHESISGCRYPQSQRELDYRYFAFELSDSPKETTYYIMIEPLLNLTMDPVLYTRDQLFKVQLRDDILYWIYIGFIIFAVIFNIIFFISTRNNSYLFLILYVLGWLGFHLSLGGIAFQYIWPQNLFWEQKSFLVITPLLGVFAILFFRTFLETVRYKWIDRIMLFILLPSALLDVILAFIAVRTTAMQMTTIRGIIFTIFNITIAAYVYLVKKNKSSLYLFIGFMGIPFSIIFMGLEASGLLSHGMLSTSSNIIANIWLIAWLTVGVSHKFILVEKRAVKSEREYDLLKDAIMDGYLVYDVHGVIKECNDTFCEMMKCSREELYNKNISTIIARNSTDDAILEQQLTDRGYTDVFEKEYLSCDTKILPIEFRVYRVKEHTNQVPRMMEIVRDVSKRKESERQLRHSQKLDAIGKLAGGIAHDFNNMLAGILGGAEVITLKLRQNDIDSCMKYAGIITETSKRASRLTNQLLNISRSTDTVRQEVDLNKVLLDVTHLLERTIDKKIQVILDNDLSDLTMMGDQDRISNAILNLGINARDAISDSGMIRFSTARLAISKQQISEWGVDIIPGKYIKITIQDDGCGISEENMEQIFDPYFTTKSIGKGTGLGLASVYGTVQDHLGHITVSSQIDKGSTFEIYFRESDSSLDAVEKTEKMYAYSGSGNILLVEDEPSIQIVVEELLASLGYHVMLANDGQQALEYYHDYKQDIDLVLMDVIMPKKNGVEVFYELKKMDPELPVILASGYANNVNIEKLTHDGLDGFIKKPFDRNSIAKLLFDVLNS